MDWLTERLEGNRKILDQLLSAPKLPFDDSLRSRLPERSGLYAISIKDAQPSEFLRAGRTKGLRQRVYQNHLMGDQKGNLRNQLVQDGECSDLDNAKEWIREKCVVQVFIVGDENVRRSAEHFVLGPLRPKYSD